MSTLQSFQQRADEIKKVVSLAKGDVPTKEQFTAAKCVEITDSEKLKENILLDFKAAVKELDVMRTGGKDRRAVDITLGEYAKERWGFEANKSGVPDTLMFALGINPSASTIDQLMTMPDFNEGYRWLIPEVIREAVRLGIRRPAIYPNLIAAEENVAQPSVIMPFINPADAMPTKIGESETIPTGTISFGQKTVTLRKIGAGLKMTDEVRQYVSLNLLGIYLQDMGNNMNMAMDSLAIATLINGDGNSNGATTIGVTTVGAFAYKDLLRAWIRMGLLGRMPQGIISNETPALEILQLPEFKGYGTGLGLVSQNSQPALAKLNLRTAVPTTTNYDIHGAMPATNQIMLVDSTSALIKLNSAALRIESDRIAERQINGTYVTLTTGFANLFDDARLIIDKSLDIASATFPASFDPMTYIARTFKD